MLELSDKERKTILFIDKAKNINKLSRLTNTTYSYQFRLVQKLESIGLVYTKINGRERNIDLTEKGKEIKWHIEQMILI